jgi:hypothetical protein
MQAHGLSGAKQSTTALALEMRTHSRNLGVEAEFRSLRCYINTPLLCLLGP